MFHFPLNTGTVGIVLKIIWEKSGNE